VRNSDAGVVDWIFNWRRQFFVWETELLDELNEVINGVMFSEEDDRWCWRSENDAAFTVKSAYHLVFNLSNPEVTMQQWHGKIFNSIWKSPTPSKVVGFVWQLLHNRLPTRSNLVTRHVVVAGDDSLCPLCHVESETESHLFLYCSVAKQVWVEIFYWLNIPFSFPHSIFSMFNCLLCTGNPNASKGRLMICCAVVWIIWKFRNSVVFDNGRGSILELVDEVKVSSWKWWLARSKKSHCLFYEWKAKPGICLVQ
jgi:hypothetical protein